ncbi:hypothetical protein ALO81_200330 [Pseudomonas cannabina]|uniref:XRE family transcriptional regulator n=1 Tax=Pseudomonas cannabina TaxID=86840 RepID=A0A0P9P5Z4_PSECA|nr:hypothetical protein ALO81_200330 [Pseudomonas cannabina]
MFEVGRSFKRTYVGFQSKLGQRRMNRRSLDHRTLGTQEIIDHQTFALLPQSQAKFMQGQMDLTPGNLTRFDELRYFFAHLTHGVVIETLGVGIDLQWHSPLRSTAIPKRSTDQLVVDTPLPTPIVLNESVFAFEDPAAFLQRVSIIPQGGGFVGNRIDSVHGYMTVRIVGVLVNSGDVLMSFHAQLTNAVFGAFEYLRICRQFVFAPRQDEVIDRVLAATTLGGNHVHFRR